MGVNFLFVFLFLFRFAESQTTIHPVNHTDLAEALADSRSNSYYGFAMILRMLNWTSQPNTDITFLIPNDSELSASSITAVTLEDFILSHSIPMPLGMNDLLHFPTRTLIPSGVQAKMMKIQNHGRMNFFINNVKIVAPNVCARSVI